ncbi:MAG: ribosome small subunit-dependent GTPase A [Chitinivibrionales bacterium]|nr:ribosome small subunit-dependent GTPase A [Chitinivibrionales bacterium]
MHNQPTESRNERPITGRVVRQHKKHYLVNSTGGKMVCTARGNVAKRSNIYVGDIVTCRRMNREPAEGIITRVHKRSNVLQRPVVANIGKLLLVFSYVDPDLDLELIDRCLFHAEFHHLPGLIIFNKQDLLNAAQRTSLHSICEMYHKINYQVMLTSATTGEGIQELAKACKNEVASMAGPSGSGKSSLLNALFPHISLPTAQTSRKIKRGTHTTSSAGLIQLPAGGYIADTPGFSVLDMPRLDATDAYSCFPELADLVGKCRFNNCRHIDEPSCEAKARLEQGTIAQSRYEHYITFYQELSNARDN